MLIEEDVGDIAKRLNEIDESLFLQWVERGEYFRVIQRTEGGSEQIVTTVKELTPALVEHVRMLGSEDYDLAKEAERMDNEAKQANDRRFSEQIGEAGERMAHAIRKDIQAKHRIFLPKGV